MKRLSVIILFLSASVVQSELDLVCLGGSLFSPIIGLICHFAPAKVQQAKDATISAAEEALQSGENLAKFDLTHNPIAITYSAIEAAKAGGPMAGLQSVGSDAKDFGEVSIGFLKGSANQVEGLAKQGLQIYDATHWNDAVFCLIKGAAQLAIQPQRKPRKRAGAPAARSTAPDVAKACISEKLQQIANPPSFGITAFNITDPDQKIGATISQIAPLLVPVGAEEEIVTDAETAAFDLVIPGSEDTTRVLKNVGNSGEHFATEEEARAVAKSMEDEQWVKENCIVCGPSAPSGGGAINFRLRRRGNIVSSCCSLPKTLPPVTAHGDFDTPFDDSDGATTGIVDDASAAPGQEAKAGASHSQALYDPIDYNAVKEADLVPAPSYIPRDPRIAANIPLIAEDLNELNTALLTWSDELTGTMSSTDIFATFRQVFTAPKDNALARALNVKARDGNLRLTSFSNDWIMSSNPILAPLQDFVNTAVTEALDTVAALKGWTPQQMADLNGNIEFFYTPPSAEAAAGVDPRGFHIDAGLMGFAAADTPGLIIRGEKLGTASRVPVVPNTFQVIKAIYWDIDAWTGGKPNGPTYHSVFGPEMAERGRVSMVMAVGKKNRPF
ncbi:MAG: hypothetical protein Q9169_003004 [Polycauliona sp. 2 TL-2023]